MSDITLGYTVPADDLRHYVTLFYHFHADVPVFEDVERADHAQIRFRLTGGDNSYTFADGSLQPAGDIHVIGPTSGAMRTRVSGPVDVIGMGLQPAGWAAMIGIDASTMLNRVIDAEILFGVGVNKVLQDMRAAPDVAAKVVIAEQFVRSALTPLHSEAISFAQQIDAWLAGSASPDVEELATAAGRSRRQVERRCNAIYGVPPKLLARKYRALRAAVALARGSATLDELLAEGFYDQSHLTRELKQFTGLTPRQMRDTQTPLAQLTIAQRVALGGKVHPIISDT